MDVPHRVCAFEPCQSSFPVLKASVYQSERVGRNIAVLSNGLPVTQYPCCLIALARRGQDVPAQGDHLAVATRERFRVLQSFERQFNIAQALMSPRELEVADPKSRSHNRRS